MRKCLYGLVALIIASIAGAPDRAAAQGVFLDVGPFGAGIGIGADPDWYGYGPYDYGPYGYYSPAYYGAPYYGYAPTRVYGYAPRTVYRYRSRAPRVYGYTAVTPPAATTTTTTVAVRGPGLCEPFFYWRDGRCVDARLK